MKNAVSECLIARWVEQPSVFGFPKITLQLLTPFLPAAALSVPAGRARRHRGAGAPSALTAPRSSPTTQRHRGARQTQNTAGPHGTMPNAILVLGKGPSH